MVVYEIENIRNRKKYIGRTKDFENRKRLHLVAMNNENGHMYNYPLYQEMREYGIDCFRFKILCWTDEMDILLDLEDYFIRKYDTIVDHGNGYNNNYGGENGLHSEATKEKLKKYNFKEKEKNHSYGKTGDKSFAGKRVINVTTGKVYSTLKECAIQEFGDEKYKKQISKCCHPTMNRFTYKGNTYRFIDDRGNIIEKEISAQPHQKKNVPVIERKSGKTFPTIADCAKYFNLSHTCIRDRIYNRIKNDKYKDIYDFQILNKR